MSTTMNELATLIDNLLGACDGLESAITGATDQFEDELAEMSTAVSALEKALPLDIDEFKALKDAGKAVVKRWAHGDLASAVNDLESAVDNA